MSLLTALLLSATHAAHAQDAPPAPTPPHALDAPFVDASHAFALHRIVQSWALQGAVAGQRPDPVRVHQVLGLRVTLRAQGHLLAYADAWRPDLQAFLQEPDPQQHPAVDLIPLTQDATFRAFADARTKLQRLAIDSRAFTNVDAAGRVPTLAELRNILTVDIQIAHSPRALTFAPNDINHAALEQFTPGHHGLLTRALPPPPEPNAALIPNPDPNPWAAVWPATALSHNANPLSQMRALARHRHDLAFHETDRFGQADGPPLWRFENLHVVRPQPGQSVFQLVRGNQLLGRTAINQATLQPRRQRIATFLLSRFLGQGTVRGTYLPSADRFDPELATLSQAALAAYALAHHQHVQEQLNAADPLIQRTRQRLNDLLQRTDTDLRANQNPLRLEADTAALLLLTRLLLAPDFQPDPDRPNQAPPPDGLAQRLAQQLLDCIDDQGNVTTPPDPNDPDAPRRRTPRAASALAAFALGQYALDDATPSDLPRDPLALAAKISNQLWQQNALNNGSALPWIAAAQDALAPAWIQAGLLNPDDAATRAQRILDTLDRLETTQILNPPNDGPADVLGGFNLNPNPQASSPRPDWRTAPLLMSYAIGLRLETQATQHNLNLPLQRPGFARLLTAQAAARFLAQLMVTPANAYYIRAPEHSIGAVRLALDDNQLSLAPAAMTLLAFDQLQLTLHQRNQNP